MMRRSVLILLLLSAWFLGHAEVREQAVTYMSVDQHGDSIRLSGLLSIPDSARGIILIPHYTIAACDESPSQKPTGEAKAFRDNYVLLMPDYIGYGITCERTHPYLHGALTARNTVDMLLGLQPMLDSLSLGISLDSIYIVGYSQGGAAASGRFGSWKRNMPTASMFGSVLPAVPLSMSLLSMRWRCRPAGLICRHSYLCW